MHYSKNRLGVAAVGAPGLDDRHRAIPTGESERHFRAWSLPLQILYRIELAVSNAVPIEPGIELEDAQRTVVLLSVVVEEMATRQILVPLCSYRPIGWVVCLPSIWKAGLFTIDAETPAEIEVIPYTEGPSAVPPQIKFKIPAGTIGASATGFARSNAVYSYVAENTVSSIGGCTGAFTITGTENEVTVTTGINCRNIIVGLPDNVFIPYLSGTGATFTGTVSADRFVGTVDGGHF